ncbi:PAS domain S-box protein [Arenibaculum pallidiluteum]|uniref:PAS domain S-box protein n=1 Tax=Arenibaculum pallidiluteum TaxID=2812559 RepID=UPI001A9788FB|nr:PAS domain S-box protein [Arenibaculum pallidiluteum]
MERLGGAGATGETILPSAFHRYGLAVASVFAALLLTALLERLGPIPVPFFLLAAVATTAWLAGLGPGLLAITLSALGFDYFFMHPLGSLRIGRDSLAYFGTFLASALATGLLSSRRRKVELSLRRMQDELEARVRERTAALETTNHALRTEIAERQAEQKFFSAILNNTDALVIALDGEECFLRFNQAAERLTGLKAADVLGRCEYDLVIPPHEAAMVKARMREVTGPSDLIVGTNHWLAHDGSLRLIRWTNTGVTNELGRLQYVVSIGLDITEQWQAELARRESDARFRDIAEIVSDWIWETGPDLSLRFLSPGARGVFGQDCDGLIGSAWEALPLTALDTRDSASLPQRMHGHQPFRNVLMRVHRGDGTHRDVKVSGKPIFDEDGQFLGYRGAGSDVTAEIDARNEASALLAALTRASRLTTMGELAASIAHEINQPLTAVVTNANACLRWLAREPVELDEARQAVRRIVRDGSRAGEVIASIRALMKKTTPEPTCVQMNQVIHEVLLLAESECRRSGIRTGLDLARDLPPVRGDRIQLQQCLLNLIMNGLEAMISVPDRPRELDIRSWSDGAGTVLVSVKDTGPGLDPATRERLFDPFFTTKASGMGMGLSICRSIVEAHGGLLSVAQASPQGAVFQLALPAMAQAEVAAAAVSPHPSHPAWSG